MPPVPARLLTALVAALALGAVQSDGCGFREAPRKGPGEPCTRTSECEVDLVCAGGSCRDAPVDGGALDASPPMDAAPPGPDATVDAALDDGGSVDAAAPSDAASAGDAEAASDAAPGADGGEPVDAASEPDAA